MTINTRRFRTIFAGLLTSVALLAIAAPQAAAQDVRFYPASTNARTFTTSAAGWTASDTSNGLCVPVLLCPPVSNTFEPAGGAQGATDGYLQTGIFGLAGVAGNVAGIWESPAFTYNGVGGQVADQLFLVLSRRAEVTDLIDAGGNSAFYTVEVVDAASGSVVSRPVDSVSIAESSPWTPIGPIVLAPTALRRERSYRLRVTSRFVFGATVVPGAAIDTDNIGLIAVREEDDNGNGGNGGPGPRGPRGPRGEGVFDSAYVTGFIEDNMADWIGIRGNRALVVTRCPGRTKRVARRCQFNVTVYWKRRGPLASNTDTVNPAPGRKAIATPTIRPRFRDRIAPRSLVLVRFQFRAGPVRVTVFKQMRTYDCARVAVC